MALPHNSDGSGGKGTSHKNQADYEVGIQGITNHHGKPPYAPMNMSQPVEFDDSFHPYENQQDSNTTFPQCESECTFPITELSSTDINNIDVHRFLIDGPSLTFTLNYSCPDNASSIRGLRLNRNEGFSHIRYAPIENSTNTTGGFTVNMWGDLRLVNQTANWTIALAQDDCTQSPVAFTFNTSNPLNLTAPSFQYNDTQLSFVDCTGNDTDSLSASNATLNQSGEYTLDFNGDVNVTVLQIAYNLHNDKNSTDRHRRSAHFGDLARYYMNSGFIPVNDPKLPANISVFSDKSGNTTRLRFKFDPSNSKSTFNGTVCIQIAVNNSVSDNATVLYSNLNVDDSLVATSNSLTTSDAIPTLMKRSGGVLMTLGFGLLVTFVV